MDKQVKKQNERKKSGVYSDQIKPSLGNSNTLAT